jgi:dihydrofolate synthase/folylpolyglutamate synthase
VSERGLDRITGLLDLLAAPHESYPIIHIAGTNGKTSTARMAAALLSAHGLTPGLFTSPHLERVEERYEYGLAVMTPEEFAEAVTELAPLVDFFEERSGGAVTYFELTAAAAFAWFAARTVDAAVLETGLGGRLDATNAARSEVAVVTSIGIEHAEFLGDTIGEIAAEKLAILDEGAGLVTGDLPPDAIEVAERVAREQDARWYRWGADIEVADPRYTGSGWAFDLRAPYGEYQDLELRVHGRHQTANFALAVASVEALIGRGLDEAGVREAAGRVSTPGRFEIVGDAPLVVLDGAHNPQAMEALAAAVAEEFPETQWALVMGVMQDKDLDAVLAPLRGLIESAHAVAADTPRAMPASDLAAAMESALGVGAEAYASVADAVDAVVARDVPVLVTGSIYVVGEARSSIAG